MKFQTDLTMYAFPWVPKACWTYRHTHTDTKIYTDKQTHRDTQRHTDTDTDTHTQAHTLSDSSSTEVEKHSFVKGSVQVFAILFF